jgi:probable phosphoglycerate mutase
MTRFLLIRHAAIDGLGVKIVGRTPGVRLNPAGRQQLLHLARQLARYPLHAVYTSPQSRARETAEAIAEEAGLKPHIAPELDEIDFGDWAGQSYEKLAQLPEWRAYNRLRSIRRIANGELLLEVQSRVIGFLARLHEQGAGQDIALVSHGDIIRVALAHFLGIPLDFILRFEIDPASISALELNDHEPRILWMNRTKQQRD